MTDNFTKVPRARVREILRSARDKMNDEGKHWIKGRLSRKKAVGMCYCSLGAINAVTPDRNERRAAKEALVALGLERSLPSIEHSGRRRSEVEAIVYTFNDSQRTSWRDVDRVFRKAVRALR